MGGGGGGELAGEWGDASLMASPEPKLEAQRSQVGSCKTKHNETKTIQDLEGLHAPVYPMTGNENENSTLCF